MKVFKEEQQFTQLWLLVLLALCLIVPVTLIIKEYTQQNSTMSSTEFIFVLLGIVASFAFIFIFKLTTRIDEYGIHYQFFPFHFSFKKIAWSEINKAYIRTYDPIGEYGGWGFKSGLLWNRKKGTAINISGTIGIQLELKNGKKLLIGTKKEQEAKHVLENYQYKIN
ncbi:hypothetical protein [Tenacibaculum discolor]|uniref:hypothetical protein n=1 Tax=Tenacibaculum discolor TaxID=361581 RepID=UPI000F10C448|nr:hypothetical protein [Tenacibaculum discolor]RLJ97861.1 hypothetical protein C8N27_2957 [Tenacibaculum discolor]